MKTLIIGGGVTGLTAAANLEGDVLLVERDNELGGYCRTTRRNGFVWDRAGHFFHFKTNQMKNFFVECVLGDNYIEVDKKTSIKYKDRWIEFPFQLNIHQLPKKEYIECLIDLFQVSENELKSDSFKDFVKNTCGEAIAEKFLIPYNEKLYACNLDDLDSNAMGRFFPKTSFKDVLIQPKKNLIQSYNSNFLYPRHGASQLINVLNKKVKNNGAKILLNTCVDKIDFSLKKASLSNGEDFLYDNLISTMPLPILLKDYAKTQIEYTSSLYSSNKVAVFNLGFDSKTDTDFHWIYFPGNEIFYRVGCYHNIFGDNRASLYVEIGLTHDAKINQSDLKDKVLVDLKKVGIINSKMKLIDWEFVLMDPAYVHINTSAETEKKKVFEQLADKNIYTIGRYGEWKYCSIEDNMLDALSITNILNTDKKNAEIFYS